MMRRALDQVDYRSSRPRELQARCRSRVPISTAGSELHPVGQVTRDDSARPLTATLSNAWLAGSATPAADTLTDIPVARNLDRFSSMASQPNLGDVRST